MHDTISDCFLVSGQLPRLTPLAQLPQRPGFETNDQSDATMPSARTAPLASTGPLPGSHSSMISPSAFLSLAHLFHTGESKDSESSAILPGSIEGEYSTNFSDSRTVQGVRLDPIQPAELLQIRGIDFRVGPVAPLPNSLVKRAGKKIKNMVLMMRWRASLPPPQGSSTEPRRANPGREHEAARTQQSVIDGEFAFFPAHVILRTKLTSSLLKNAEVLLPSLKGMLRRALEQMNAFPQSGSFAKFGAAYGNIVFPNFIGDALTGESFVIPDSRRIAFILHRSAWTRNEGNFSTVTK